MFDLVTALQRLYESGANIRMSCFWDSGWMVQLGDDTNGYFAQRNFGNDELGELAGWIEAECAKPRVYKSELAYAIEHSLQPAMGSVRPDPHDCDAEIKRITDALDNVKEVNAAIETGQRVTGRRGRRA